MVPEGELPQMERAHLLEPDDPRLVVCEQANLAPVSDIPMSHNLKTYLSGLIKGSTPHKKIIFSCPWISAQNVAETSMR